VCGLVSEEAAPVEDQVDAVEEVPEPLEETPKPTVSCRSGFIHTFSVRYNVFDV